MTLSTHIYVMGPVNVPDLFAHCRSLLGATKRHSIKDRSWDKDDPGQRSYGHDWGVGLPAYCGIDYRGDGPGTPTEPLRTPEQATAHDEWCDEDCNGHYHQQACWEDIMLDTTYGYRDAKGWGCGDLHAFLIAGIGGWLDAHDVPWGWNNEFTSERWFGEDRYKHLPDLGSGGRAASDWFQTKAMPAIAAHMAQEMSKA